MPWLDLSCQVAPVMDSPLLQSFPQSQRVRANSSLSVHSSTDHHGAVRKRSIERARSISASQADQLHLLALQQSNQDEPQQVLSTLQLLLTPQQSPQPQPVFCKPSSLEPFPTWTVPTPPRSDSGVPSVSVDTSEDPTTTGITGSQEYHFEQPTTSVEMSSLGFLLPSQYGTVGFESETSSYTMDQNSIPPMRVTHPPATSGRAAYTQATSSSSPSLYQSRHISSTSSARRHSDLPNGGSTDSYDQTYPRISNTYDSATTGHYSVGPSQTIPSISGLTQSPLPSPHLGSNTGSMPQYNAGYSRSPNPYDSGLYAQPYTTAPSSTQLYSSTQNMSYPPPFFGNSMNEVLAKPLGSDSSIRVLNQRPKPQCWEHGCNGRQFSTFSNLLRHQREKSGTAAKSYCPKCGAEFTRTTARNGHLAHDKCSKARRASDVK